MSPQARPAPSAPAAPVIAGRVTLRTLILIRWVAVAGQLATVMLVYGLLDFELPLGPALGVIGASVLLNLASSAQPGPRPRLTDRTAALFLGWDVIQLSLLLYLTGGIQNPFSVLILAPLTVAATILSLGSVVLLVTLAVSCLSGLALWHYALPWPGALPLPGLYSFGIWMALVCSAVFVSGYVWRVARETRQTYEALAASQEALARAQKLSALGGLAAAAAHELGTPLGTISLVAKELAREVPPDSPIAEDIALLQSQAVRCRDILAELSRRPDTEGGEPYERLTLRALVETAAAGHKRPGIALTITERPGAGADVPQVPMIRRSPEIIHGLGNIMQNAMQFARSAVEVTAEWDLRQLSLTIVDDGPGFPGGLLARIGEPYISSRSDGGGMGLGIFIARTLLERTGARVAFTNGRGGGAQVVVTWAPPVYADKYEATSES
ncbi:ActS/PrrB/RegB family redox-sensitive histidine kinase [Arenibaculum pallidiluteum]|uniref:ActS/PrrB/RegB family redox-sensitive histidine kinase n=1 Tax=Arenibaculum pallidiluteum TaxID=2812559 RepID=UPI001A97BA06|nr:ActS/PrrB/RegB family redox-sensitive histidine kinase [Arenibaculum pallidiluteum]